MLFKKILNIFIITFLVFFQPLLSLDIPSNELNLGIVDNIIIDTSKEVANNATLTQAGNGIDVIDIASPDDRGISNNYYLEFNVKEKGLILNNSKDLFIKTQLAGYINGNRHIKDKEAKLIVNQITGDNDSKLLGYIETAGKQANVIIANPNGITCKGCGFINNTSATLSTGKVILEGEKRYGDARGLDALDERLSIMVQRGHINIEALDASNIPILNLLAKSIEVKGRLFSDELNMILGQNNISLSDDAFILLYEPILLEDDMKKDKTALALDVAYLGGIEAKSIYLVATEEGIGVKDSGFIATHSSVTGGDGGFVIDVNGNISISYPKDEDRSIGIARENQGNIIPMLYSSSYLSIKAKGIENHSLIYAKGNIDIKANEIENKGILELERKEVDRKPGYEKTPGDDYFSVYNYNTIIYQDRLKEESYSPAILMSDGSIHIKANTLNNDSAILKARGDTFLEVKDITNLAPTPKRVVQKDGTRQDYSRFAGGCGVIFWDKHKNCHSKWYKPKPFRPAPSVSSIELAYPEVDLPALMMQYQKEFLSLKLSALTQLAPFVESDPLYTDKSIFLQSDAFRTHLDIMLASAPSLFFDDKYIALVSKDALLSSIASSPDSQAQEILNHLSSQNNFLEKLNQTRKENDLISLNTLNPDFDNPNPFNLSSNAGIFGNRLIITSDYLKNTSLMASYEDMMIGSAVYFINQNASVMAKGNIGIQSGDFSHISSAMKSYGDIYLESPSIDIQSGVNKQRFDLKPKHHFYWYSKPIFYSYVASLDSSSSISSNNLFINGENITIKGSHLLADDTIGISGGDVDISTTAFSSFYADGKQTYQNTNQFQSSIKANHIRLSAFDDMSLASVDVNGDDSISINSGKNLNITALANSSYMQNKLTDYKGSFLKSTTTDTININTSSTYIAPSFKGKEISLFSASDLNAHNLSIHSLGDVSLASSGNLTLSNLADSFSNTKNTYSKTTGFDFSSSDGKYSMSYGIDTIDTHSKDSFSLHKNQSIVAKNIIMSSTYGKVSVESSNLIANADEEGKDGGIYIDSKGIDIISLEDEYHKEYSNTMTSNRIGISVNKVDVGEALATLGKKTLQATGKVLSKIKNPKNIFHKSGDWMKNQSEKIDAAPSLKDIDFNISMGFNHTQNKEMKNQSQSIASSSKLKANHIALDASKGNINVVGSDFLAEDVFLRGEGIYILAAEDKQKISSQSLEKTFSASLSMNVGKNTFFGGDGLFEYSEDTKNSTFLTHKGSNINANNLSINSSKDTNIIGSSLNANNNTSINATSLYITGVDDSYHNYSTNDTHKGKIHMGYNGGFEGEIQGQTSSSKTQESEKTNQESSLKTTSLQIHTAKDTNIIGSNVGVEEKALIESGDFIMQAASNSSFRDFYTWQMDFSLKASYGNLGGDMQAGWNAQDSQNHRASNTYQNASLSASNLMFKTNGDMNIKGGVISTADMQANIKGDLNIQSLQDTVSYSSNMKNIGVNIEMSSFSPEVSMSKESSGFNNVSSQSGIVATENLQINTSNHIDLKAAYIEAGDRSIIMGKSLSQTQLSNTSYASKYNINSNDLSFSEKLLQNSLPLSDKHTGFVESSIDTTIALDIFNGDANVNRGKRQNNQVSYISPQNLQNPISNIQAKLETSIINPYNTAINNMQVIQNIFYSNSSDMIYKSSQSLINDYKDMGIETLKNISTEVIDNITELDKKDVANKIKTQISNEFVDLGYQVNQRNVEFMQHPLGI